MSWRCCCRGCCVFWAVSWPLACWAAPPVDTLQLEPITVLGTRTDKTTSDVSRSIDVVDQQQIAREQPDTLGQALEKLPNVSFTGSARPVGQQINIRGLSGTRVLTRVDGVRLDNDMGHVGGNYVAPGMIKSVEVERGPASVLWGSGALGGVVNVKTKNAEDLLKEDEDFGARLHTGYQSASHGWQTGGSVYGHLGDDVDALVHLGRTSHEDLKLGSGERLPYSAYHRLSGLAKATWHIAPGQSLQFSHRSMRLTGESPFNAGEALDPKNVLVNRTIRLGTSHLEWGFLAPESELVDLKVGLSHRRTRSDTQWLTAPKTFAGKIAGYGLEVSNTSRLDGFSWGRHAVTYGVDLNRNVVDTDKRSPTDPQSVHARDWIVGVFAQDETHWSRAWTSTLGLRYDHYQSKSTDGAHEQSDSGLSAQAGLLWQATDWLQLYANYAEAFRAPSVTEMYQTGTHFGANTFVPNAELKPEKAANKEVGLRARWNGLFTSRDHLKLKLSVFSNRVDDYIETRVHAVELSHPPYVGGTTTVKNVHDAKLEGFETSVTYTTDHWFAGLSYGQTRGTNKTDHQPLDDIPANTWTARVGVKALPWDGRITWRMTHAAAQNRVSPKGTPPGTDGGTPTGSYTVYDLLTRWHPTANTDLTFGIGNITNRDYRRHTSAIDAAGRNVKLGLALTF